MIVSREMRQIVGVELPVPTTVTAAVMGGHFLKKRKAARPIRTTAKIFLN